MPPHLRHVLTMKKSPRVLDLTFTCSVPLLFVSKLLPFPINLLVMLFRRREIPWEVVDSRSVDPVPMYYDDEDLDLVLVKEGNVRRTYVVEVKREALKTGVLPRAVIFARDQLIQEVKKNGYNVLLHESWRVTVLRKGKLNRIEVEYSGRPARAQNKVPHRHPPYMAILGTCD